MPSVSPSTSPFRALRHRNFRLLWLGQLVSMTGSMMQMAAQLWHVSLLVPPAQKGFALGAVGFVRLLPILGFSILGGVVADARDRRTVMLGTQTVMALSAGVLAFLTFRGLHDVWPIYILAAVSAGATAFDIPARASLMPSLVPVEDLPNAITLSSAMFQAASVLGPSLAGIFIATSGVGAVYAFNAVSFLAVIGALIAMRSVPKPAAGTRSDVSLGAGLEGLRFVFSRPLIRSAMLLDFFATFFASATALLPIFAQDILKVGASGYGWLYAAPSIGALFTSFLMVRFVDRIQWRGRVMILAAAGFGLATVLFGFSRSFWLTFACLALTGVTDTVSMTLRNVVRQLSTPDEMRGRMTSVNMVFFMGGPQLGEMEAGLVAGTLGAPFSVISGGIGCVLATMWIAARTPVLWNHRRPDLHGGPKAG